MTNARSLGNTRLSMLAAPRALSSRAEFVADIRREWTNALESTVQVGRRLNEAKAALPHGEYEAMVQADLPFGPSTARKLREVAEFVDAGKVPLDQLPEAYSTLYVIATLPEEVREEAVAQGVIRPDVTRAEVEAFKETKAPTKSAPLINVEDADLFAPASPRVQDSPPTVFGSVAAASWVQVPDQLLIRLDAALRARGLIGPDDITLHYPVSGDRVQLRRYDDGAYRIAAHDINGMVYVGSCMSATKLADFLRDWLALDLFAPASPTAAPPPPTPRVIDVEPEVVTDSAPPMNRLAAPASAVPASRFSAALGLRWHPDPTDPSSIMVELEGQRRVLFVMVPHDPAAADIVRHVIALHNASQGA